MRQCRNEDLKVREAAGCDSFEGKRTTPAEEILMKKRRCGYNRLWVVESTPGAGYGLFMKAPIVKAGGLLGSEADQGSDGAVQVKIPL